MVTAVSKRDNYFKVLQDIYSYDYTTFSETMKLLVYGRKY